MLLHLLLFVGALVWLPAATNAYLLGDESEVYCWRTNYTTGDALNVGEYRVCPPAITSHFTIPFASDLNHLESAPAQFSISIDLRALSASEGASTTLAFTSSPHVSHANVHACRSNLNCVPSVAPESNIVAHSTVQSANVDANGTATFNASLELETGAWTLIGHSRFQLSNGIQYDVAAGTSRTVLPPPPSNLASSLRANLTATESNVLIGAALVFLVFAIALLVRVVQQRNDRALFFAMPLLLALMTAGAIAVAIAALLAAAATDHWCALQNVLLHCGLSLMFLALFGKLFRLLRVFGNTSLSTSTVRSRDLLGAIAAVIVVEIIVIAADPCGHISTAVLCAEKALVLASCAFLDYKLDRLVPDQYKKFRRDLTASTRVLYNAITFGTLLVAVGLALDHATLVPAARTLIVAYSTIWIAFGALAVGVAPYVAVRRHTEDVAGQRLRSGMVSSSRQLSESHSSSAQRRQSVAARTQRLNIEVEKLSAAEGAVKMAQSALERAEEKYSAAFEGVVQARADLLFNEQQERRQRGQLPRPATTRA